MANKHVGRAPIGSAVLLIIVVMILVLSRTPLFGLEWLTQRYQTDENRLRGVASARSDNDPVADGSMGTDRE